ncbi:MAG: N-acetyltransferase family protein [Candidatus Aenigmatarchaeota archaeon]
MLVGNTVDEFEVEGKEVKIRYPEMKDLDDLLEYINSLIEEGGYLLFQEKKTREEEIGWLSDVLENNESGEKIYLVVEVKGEVMGGASVECGVGAKSHVGKFGIGLKKDVREMGIGTRLAEAIFNEAEERLGIEIIKMEVFESNKRAISFYKSLGFEERGRIRDGAYVQGSYEDTVIMQKDL